MFQHIVVPLDSSAGAEHAIPVAARLARVAGGTIVFVRVFPSSGSPGVLETMPALAVQPSVGESHLTEAEHYLTRVMSRYANELSGIQVEHTVVGGSASSAILAVAGQEPNDLIVLSSHRAHGLFHWTLSGVIHEALSHTPAPLLLLNEAGGPFLEPSQERPLRVLLPLSGSVLSEAAIRPALDLAAAFAGSTRSIVHLFQVVDQPFIPEETQRQGDEIGDERIAAWKEAETYLQELAHRLRKHPSCPVITWSVRIDTDVAGTIARIAEPSEGDKPDRGYDLVALTTHGRHAHEHLMLGRVSERMLGATQRPLLLVRPPHLAGSVSGQNDGLAPVKS